MSELSFALGSTLHLSLELEEARFGLRPEDLFRLAARQNPRRAFLFVSRVLGKHLPIRPAALLAAGKLLALAWLGQTRDDGWAGVFRGAPVPFREVWDRLEGSRRTLSPQERTLFIGFAETATGLARAVADCFDGEMACVSTTRLEIPGRAPLTCDERHSHARSHLLYLDAEDPFLTECRQVVLVDDELTTGNTALQLVRTLHAAYGMRRFTLMSLLDNSSGEARRALERELGVEIRAVSLLRGRIARVWSGDIPVPALTDLRGSGGEAPAMWEGGRASLSERTLQSARDLARQRLLCRELAGRLGPRPADTLYLGTGEFIYAPALIAGFCGGGWFHSTTQSPVCPLPGSAVTSGVRFDPPDRYSPVGCLYNVPRAPCGEAVIFAEGDMMRRPGLHQLTSYLRGRGVEKVTVCAL